jgi:hypothetical protein
MNFFPPLNMECLFWGTYGNGFEVMAYYSRFYNELNKGIITS